MAEPTRLLCAPWITIVDLPESKPTLDDATWDDLCWSASELLYLWSGRQYSGGCSSTVVLRTPPSASGSATPSWYAEVPWGDSGSWDPWLARAWRGVRESVVARLPDPPVTAITSLTIDGVAQVEGTDYIARLPAGLIYRTDARCWPTHDDSVQVSYDHGIAPPVMGKRAAALLALELGKSWTGAKCNLPKRIESITREGIAINLAVALQGWRTGIWDIDAWLHSVNPNMMTRRARAWSPDISYARRVRTP